MVSSRGDRFVVTPSPARAIESEDGREIFTVLFVDPDLWQARLDRIVIRPVLEVA
jgi:hypothetical protein